QGNWAAAVEHLGPLIEAAPGQWRPLVRRGRAHKELGHLAEAAADLSRALELEGKEDPSVWSDRGEGYAELGRWPEAAADLGRAVGDGLTTVRPYLALALLGAGDGAGYRQACAELLVDYEKKNDGGLRPEAAFACAAAPDAGVEPARLLAAVERSLGDNPRDYLGLRLWGASLYRAGKYEEALQRLTEA